MAERTIKSASPFQRIALLAVVELADRGEEPVRSYDVRRACDAHAEALEAVPFGGASRQEVINALNGLAAAGLLEEERVRSPVGKWRPAYALATSREAVLDALADDEHVGRLAGRVRED